MLTSDKNKKQNYHDNTVIFSVPNTDREYTDKNTFWNFTKIFKIIIVLCLFISIIFLIVSYSTLTNKNVGWNLKARNYSEIISIPIINMITTLYIGIITIMSTKSEYTVGHHKFSLIINLINILFSLITPLLTNFMDISTKGKWSTLFLAIGAVETLRIVLGYFFLLIKGIYFKKLLPIELAKIKRIGFMVLLPICIPLMLYGFVFVKRIQQNSTNSLIMMVLMVLISCISILINLIIYIRIQKYINTTNSFIEEEEKESMTFLNYILVIMIAPLVGIGIANLKSGSSFNYGIGVSIALSVGMLISYLTLTIIDFKRKKEQKRTPIINSLILWVHLFVVGISIFMTNIFMGETFHKWNYLYLIVFGLYAFLILLTTISFNVGIFKYLSKLKITMITCFFIILMLEILIICSVLNNEIILIIYNAEIVMTLFIWPNILMFLLLIIDTSLLIRWTRNFMHNNKKENAEAEKQNLQNKIYWERIKHEK